MMKRTIFILFLFCFLPSLAIAQANERLSLSSRFSADSLSKIILDSKDWQPFPTAAERHAWSAIPERVQKAHIQQGVKALEQEWTVLPATVFLEFERTGNRSNYQKIRSSRRTKLAHLVLAEIFESRGRFLDEIVNGIWLICEETYWGVPAHLNIQSRGYGLPDVTEPTVDLFAAETGSLLGWTLYLLGPQLQQVSPLVNERILYELDRRILAPNYERDDFWWMSFVPDVINNWNPWVNSNWLSLVLLWEKDPDRRIAAIHKILRSLDRFIASYPQDGGCDEGPGYWNRAAASLFDCLDLLHDA